MIVINFPLHLNLLSQTSYTISFWYSPRGSFSLLSSFETQNQRLGAAEIKMDMRPAIHRTRRGASESFNRHYRSPPEMAIKAPCVGAKAVSYERRLGLRKQSALRIEINSLAKWSHHSRYWRLWAASENKFPLITNGFPFVAQQVFDNLCEMVLIKTTR